jgi:hypothetical protein
VLAALRHALSDALEVREQAASSVFPPSLDLGAMVQGLFGGAGGAGNTGAGEQGGLGFLGAFGASMPAGMPPGIGDFMNELFGPDGPVADFSFDQVAGDDDFQEDDDEDVDDAEDGEDPTGHDDRSA